MAEGERKAEEGARGDGVSRVHQMLDEAADHLARVLRLEGMGALEDWIKANCESVPHQEVEQLRSLFKAVLDSVIEHQDKAPPWIDPKAFGPKGLDVRENFAQFSHLCPLKTKRRYEEESLEEYFCYEATATKHGCNEKECPRLRPRKQGEHKWTGGMCLVAHIGPDGEALPSCKRCAHCGWVPYPYDKPCTGPQPKVEFGYLHKDGHTTHSLYDIVRSWLVSNGYEGLCGDGCGCRLDDLMPCDNPDMKDCNAAYEHPCNPKECDGGCESVDDTPANFCMRTTKPHPKEESDG